MRSGATEDCLVLLPTSQEEHRHVFFPTSSRNAHNFLLSGNSPSPPLFSSRLVHGHPWIGSCRHGHNA